MPMYNNDLQHKKIIIKFRYVHTKYILAKGPLQIRQIIYAAETIKICTECPKIYRKSILHLF